MRSDLRVGFSGMSFTVAESAGVLEVGLLAYDKVDVGLPFGVRVTSRDGSAVGKLCFTALNSRV